MKIRRIVMLPLICTFFEMLSADALAQLPTPKPLQVCADRVPDLEKLYPGDLLSRRKAFQVNTAVSHEDPARQMTRFAFEYPTLRGWEEWMNRAPSDYHRVQTKISVGVYRISDWNKLPKSDEVKFYRQYDYRDYYSGKKAIPSYRNDIAAIKSPISEVGAGLTMYVTGRRDDLFMFHPTGTPWGPYDLPRLNCRGSYPSGTTYYRECHGRMRIGPDLLVLYWFPLNALPCWASIEESIKQVIRITKANE